MNTNILAGFRAIFAILMIGATVVIIHASGAGSLDLSFNNGAGYKLDTYGTQPGFDGGYKTIVQPDGKILVGVGGWSLGRYNADGSADLTFGTGGKVITTFGQSFAYVSADMALQTDGKIVVVGWKAPQVPELRQLLAVRYNTDGTLDTGFGVNGTVVTVVEQPSCQANKVAIQPDGKILVSGDAFHPVTISGYTVLLRYNSNGSLDTTFDGDGVVSNRFMNGATGSALALQADGKILIGSSSNGESRLAVARYNSDGSPDTSFDSDGRVTTDIGTYATLQTLEAMPDGRIIAGGSINIVSGVDTDFALLRYSADGSLDTSFDGDGKVFTHLTSGYDNLSEIAIQADGKIIASGSSWPGPSDLRLLRYNTDGSLDTSYGAGGIATIDLGANEGTSSVALDAAGRAVVVGSSSGLLRTLIARVTAEAAPLVDVGGRVTNANGNGIANVDMVLMSQSQGARWTRTNGFGYYFFSGIPSNEVYSVSTSSKRYSFLPDAHMFSLLETDWTLDFVGTPYSNGKSVVKGDEKLTTQIRKVGMK